MRCDDLGEALLRRGLEPEIVVNNAGFGLLGDAAALDRAEQLAMIDLNVRALTDLSLAFVDTLARRRGGILNVASVAGFLPGPGMAVYYASKAYVLSFSEALHHELAPRGVRVTALCPGPVPTEFQARAGIELRAPLLTCSPEQVARAGYRGLAAAGAWSCRASPTGCSPPLSASCRARSCSPRPMPCSAGRARRCPEPPRRPVLRARLAAPMHAPALQESNGRPLIRAFRSP